MCVEEKLQSNLRYLPAEYLPWENDCTPWGTSQRTWKEELTDFEDKQVPTMFLPGQALGLTPSCIHTLETKRMKDGFQSVLPLNIMIRRRRALLLLLLSHFSRVWLLATPWTAAYHAPPSMGFCSSIHGIFQARVLEWVAIAFSRRRAQSRAKGTEETYQPKATDI